uniref:Sigma-70 family RNA polymerase sigma factor n=1 Tax=Heterorhabditis bacteriophora TaxID=37862 RepID=A0A1I7XBB2_HETBA
MDKKSRIETDALVDRYFKPSIAFYYHFKDVFIE